MGRPPCSKLAVSRLNGRTTASGQALLSFRSVRAPIARGRRLPRFVVPGELLGEMPMPVRLTDRTAVLFP